MREPRWIEPAGSGWKCALCPQGCIWSSGRPLGLCRVRGLTGGVPDLPGWGKCVSLSLDPIEKKPLYHFLPGRAILSTGPSGCNLSCRFCQNWTISQEEAPTRFVEPDLLAALSLEDGSCGIAFTYTEPVIWFEYIAEVAPLVRSRGGAVVMVSNGFVNPDPLEEYLRFTDAWNIDLKGWSPDFYRKLCGGDRDVVLSTIRRVAKSCVHLEITLLLIPGENDSPAEWGEMAAWIASEVGPDTPLHISRYFPRYFMKNPPTPPETVYRAVELFSSRLRFVYPGNLTGESSTKCPSCGSMAIRRLGWSVDPSGLRGGACGRCGEPLGIVTDLRPAEY